MVVLLDDGSGRLLLTRRAAHMRTFPCCWVFPGGAVDDGEGVLDAGAREVLEETGLSVATDSFSPVCAWESVYPTTHQQCLEVGQVKGHSLVVFLVGAVPEDELPRLRLQRAECDMCAWVPLSELAALHGEDAEASADGTTVTCLRVAESEPPGADEDIVPEVDHSDMAELVPAELTPSQLHGIYPNEAGEGIGQGHLFALATLLASRGQEAAVDGAAAEAAPTAAEAGAGAAGEPAPPQDAEAIAPEEAGDVRAVSDTTALGIPCGTD